MDWDVVELLYFYIKQINVGLLGTSVGAWEFGIMVPGHFTGQAILISPTTTLAQFMNQNQGYFGWVWLIHPSRVVWSLNLLKMNGCNFPLVTRDLPDPNLSPL